MRSRQVSLPRLRWRTTPGSFGARRETLVREPLAARSPRRAPSRQPASGLRASEPRRPPLGAITRHDLADRDLVAGGEALDGRDDAGARRRNHGLHLHGGDDEEGVASGHAVAFGAREPRAPSPRRRHSTPCWPVGHLERRQRRARARRDASRPAGLLRRARAVRARAAPSPSWLRSRGSAPRRGARCARRRRGALRFARMARSCAKVGGQPRRRGTRRARRACGRARSRSPAIGGRSPSRAADRTAAAARSPRSRRRRRARRDRSAPCRR